MRMLRLALVSVLLAGANAPLALLQGCAWTRMIWRGVGRGSLSQAISQALDGRHPCAFCLSIRKAASAPILIAAASAPLDLIVVSVTGAVRPPVRRERLASSWFEPGSAVVSPQTPPPKSSLV